MPHQHLSVVEHQRIAACLDEAAAQVRAAAEIVNGHVPAVLGAAFVRFAGQLNRLKIECENERWRFHRRSGNSIYFAPDIPPIEGVAECDAV